MWYTELDGSATQMCQVIMMPTDENPATSREPELTSNTPPSTTVRVTPATTEEKVENTVSEAISMSSEVYVNTVASTEVTTSEPG